MKRINRLAIVPRCRIEFLVGMAMALLPLPLDAAAAASIGTRLRSGASRDGSRSGNAFDQDSRSVFIASDGATFSSTMSSDVAGVGVYQYNICNGLSNQLLYHAASIARAYEADKIAEIPDYYIVNGVQTKDDDVLPSPSNSVPFGDVFDREHFSQALARMGIRARFVTFDFSKPQIPCPGIGSLNGPEPLLLFQIIQAFQPSSKMQPMISNITRAFESLDPDRGICLHHRDGQDWHDHCARWSSIGDGIYRGNCLGETHFLESLKDRGLTNTQWLYYCGDHEVPQDLKQAGVVVVSQKDLLSSDDQKRLRAIKPGADGYDSLRDLHALIDFYACSRLQRFIGNSVSTFSAIQIALRDGEGAHWYNSRSIPLGSIWRIYQIPLVYTYTELSVKSGKHLLQASIKSVRKQMPNNKIHILYHGTEDRGFREWLSKHGVIIHQHYPTWRGQIEEMRKHGDPGSSNLFLHPGNYLGTWQRIDIPLMMESEYCLLLDSDTVVTRPFTLADFGLEITDGLAMSSEFHAHDTVPSNAGVTVMNIPFLRRTYDSFLNFILQHVDTAKFNHPSPSDQGAYMDFYGSKTRFLSQQFNFKPYWKVDDNQFGVPYVYHFHGAKPHDYLKAIMGKECDQALQGLCHDVAKMPHLCRSMQQFAKASLMVESTGYCKSSFSVEAEALLCNNIMESLAKPYEDCSDFGTLVSVALARVPEPLRLELKTDVIKNIVKGFRRKTSKAFKLMMELWIVGWLVLFSLVYVLRKRLQVVACLSLLWACGTMLIYYYHVLSNVKYISF